MSDSLVNPPTDWCDNDRTRNNSSTRGDNNSTDRRSSNAARPVDTGGTVDHRACFSCRQGNEAT